MGRFDGSEWIVDFDFRSNGAERGGGNLQLWYVKDGLSKISTASVYTAGRFDGFVLVIDVPNGRVSLEGPRDPYRIQRFAVDANSLVDCDFVF